MDENDWTHFGDLELAVMGCLWEAHQPLTVGEVQERLSSERELAYTTVLTVLSNLHKKEAVDRARKGRAHVYWALHKRDQAAAGIFHSLLDRFYNNNPAALLAGFLKTSKPLSKNELARVKEELSRLESECE